MVGATCAVPTVGVHRHGLEVRIGQQQNDIRVVMGEPAVLGLFRVLLE